MADRRFRSWWWHAADVVVAAVLVAAGLRSGDFAVAVCAGVGAGFILAMSILMALTRWDVRLQIKSDDAIRVRPRF